jgi:hypothetical protein
MPKSYLAISLTIFFSIISVIHIYWAFGGEKGIRKAIPTNDGKPLFNPGPVSTLIIGLLLNLLSILILEYSDVMDVDFIPKIYIKWMLLICAGFFLLRSIGDFKYAGFTKKITNSPFAYWDTRLYSPIFLILSIAFVYFVLG